MPLSTSRLPRRDAACPSCLLSCIPGRSCSTKGGGTNTLRRLREGIVKLILLPRPAPTALPAGLRRLQHIEGGGGEGCPSLLKFQSGWPEGRPSPCSRPMVLQRLQHIDGGGGENRSSLLKIQRGWPGYRPSSCPRPMVRSPYGAPLSDRSSLLEFQRGANNKAISVQTVKKSLFKHWFASQLFKHCSDFSANQCLNSDFLLSKHCSSTFEKQWFFTVKTLK